jgi:hypothetical protein
MQIKVFYCKNSILILERWMNVQMFSLVLSCGLLLSCGDFGDEINKQSIISSKNRTFFIHQEMRTWQTNRLIVGLKPSSDLTMRDFLSERFKDTRILSFSDNLRDSRVWVLEMESPYQAFLDYERTNYEMTQDESNKHVGEIEFIYPDSHMTMENRLQDHEDIQCQREDCLPGKFEISSLQKVPSGKEAKSLLVDPLTPAGWHHKAIGADATWQKTLGSPAVKIAVIDLGFEQSHPDLQSAWLGNMEEVPANNLDDDQNGLVDDVSGWNFATHSADLIYGAGPAHGTATSGVIGARQNGFGTQGICSRCSLLPLVIDDRVSSAILAFQYARAMNVAVVSNSWGYALEMPSMQGLMTVIEEITQYGRGGLGTSVVFAMSNKARNDCEGVNADISALESVIAVSSVDQQDQKVASSGFGPCLDIVAPSSSRPEGGIVTTDRVGSKGINSGSSDDFSNRNYTKKFYGTSAAAPQVAGALGLIYSLDPNLSAKAAASKLFQLAEKVNTDVGQYDPQTGKSPFYGYGRLNIGGLK